MNLSIVTIGGIFLLLSARETCGQVTNSEGSAVWLANKIAADGPGTVSDYLDYAQRLARILSQHSAATQRKIFGFLPPSGGGVGGVAGNNGSNQNPPPSPAQALSNPALSSAEVFDILLNSSPLSDQDLLAAMERDPAIDSQHLTDLLTVQGKLSNGFLVSSLASAKSKLGSEALKNVLISSSPLDEVVLKKVNGTSNLTPADIAAVLAAQ